MSTQLCLEAFDMTVKTGRKPEIFNTDQGSQYTSHEWLKKWEEQSITISMDGKGRWADNIAVERFWRTFKYDCFLLNEVNTLEAARRLIARWLSYYNQERPHARLENLSPSEYCRQKGYPPCGEFFARFFRSDAARVAPLRALATLGTQHLRYKIAQKKMDLLTTPLYAIKPFALIRAIKQEELACLCQKEDDSLRNRGIKLLS